jgi:hypothetical protein
MESVFPDQSKQPSNETGIQLSTQSLGEGMSRVNLVHHVVVFFGCLASSDLKEIDAKKPHKSHYFRNVEFVALGIEQLQIELVIKDLCDPIVVTPGKAQLTVVYARKQIVGVALVIVLNRRFGLVTLTRERICSTQIVVEYRHIRVMCYPLEQLRYGFTRPPLRQIVKPIDRFFDFLGQSSVLPIKDRRIRDFVGDNLNRL